MTYNITYRFDSLRYTINFRQRVKNETKMDADIVLEKVIDLR